MQGLAHPETKLELDTPHEVAAQLVAVVHTEYAFLEDASCQRTIHLDVRLRDREGVP